MCSPITSLAVLLLVGGCLSAHPTLPSEPPSIELNNNDQKMHIYFAQTMGKNGARDALLVGALAVRDRCLYVDSEGESFVVVWPPHVELTMSRSTVRLTDSENGASVDVGEVVRIGGNRIATDHLAVADLREPIPPHCSGPLWLAKGFSLQP